MEKTVVVSSTTTTSVPAAATGQNNDVQVSFTYSNSNSNNTAGGSSGGTVVAPSTGHNNNNEHENVIKFYEIGPGDDEVTDIKVEVKEEIEMISESDASHVEIKVPDTKHVYGRLTYKDEVLMITEDYVEIGRNSSTSSVHFHVGRNSFVSRKHLRIWHASASDPNGLTKYNKLFGKKGVGIGKPSPIKSDMDDDDDGLGFIVTDEAGNIIKKRGASDDTGWRKRLRIDQLANSDNFYLICLSKNGVFVDDIFQRKTSEPFRLPARCTLRFPSTNIRILFESFLDGSDGQSHSPQDIEDEQIIVHSIGGGSASNQQAVGVIYSPLEITIPKQQDGGGTGVGSSARLSIKSPYPSPSGTISAANSCPTSPRHSYNDYHNFSYSSQGASNSSNNYQDDFFQPPSTSAYVNDYEKPPYSYAQLIVQSISAAPDKQLTLSGIYTFISKNYPYYRKEANKGWQNSIRHNLSLNRYFIKVARTQDEPGKGSFWRIDPTCEAKLIDQSYKKRRQRGSQIFRPPYGMPRSAPVSPSHIDNSRENSPLQDVMLQSAPGSPGGGNAIAGNSHNNYVGGDIELADDGVETWQTVKITNASSSDVGRDNKKRQSNKPNIITVTNDMYYSVHGDIGANVSTSGEAVITETVETSAVVGEELDSDDRQGAYVRFTESQRSTSLSPQPAEQSTDGGNIEPATTTASADSYGREVCF